MRKLDQALGELQRNIQAVMRRFRLRGKGDGGAHVQLKDTGGNHWHIVPMRKTHNGKRGQELAVMGGARPIPVTARGRRRP